MEQSELKQLKLTAAKARLYGVQMVHDAASGHPGGSLSCMDVLTYLYFAFSFHICPDIINHNIKQSQTVSVFIRVNRFIY